MPAAILPDRSSPRSRALAWSLALHVVAVVVAALPWVRSALATWQAAAQERAAAAVPPLAPVEIEVVVPEVTVVRPPPTPAESFIRTDGLPEAKPEPGSRRFVSDRDTRAASPLAADPTATEAQPTQDGIDIPVVEVIRREASDGEDEALPPSAAVTAAPAAASRPPAPAAAESPADAAAVAQEDLPSAPASAPPASEPDAEPSATPPPERIPDPVEQRLALATESVVKVRVEPDPALKPPVPAKPARPVAALREPEVASRPPVPPRPASPPGPAGSTPPAGFSGLRTPTKLRGTITNQGPASVDAEDTPTGRYMKQVTGAIEREWHRKRRLNRDFVTFGTIKLEFHVNARGEVQNLTIKNRSGANAVMQDFTLNAVLDAPIPPMPPGLTEILDRELLLISYDIIVY
jgi:outer membrane biosynthesis protein TonB